MPKHFDEVGEELPCFVELSQQDWQQLIDVQHYLIEEVDEKFRVRIWKHFAQGFSWSVARIFREESVLEGRIVTGQTILNDVRKIVEDELFIIAVFLLLNGSKIT
jgi:hypothetical protein